MSARWSASLLALALAACEPGDGIDALELRPNVRTVDSFAAVTEACLFESGCPAYVFPTIRDVARDGQVVAVLYTWPQWNGRDYTQSSGLAASFDGGESWRRIERSGMGSAGAGTGLFPTGITVRGRHAYLLTPWEEELGTGRWPAVMIDDVDLDTGLTRPATGVRSALLHDDGELLWSYDYYGPAAALASTWGSLDPATGTVGGEAEALTTDITVYCPNATWYGAPSPTRGIELYTVCHRDGRTLLGRAVVPDEWRTPGFTAIPDAEWPVPPALQSTEVHYTARARSAVLFTEGDGAAAITRSVRSVWRGVTSELVVDEVGPGAILRPHRLSVGIDRLPFADMIALTEPLPDESVRTTLYRPGPTGTFRPIALPTRPCDEGRYCGYLAQDYSVGLLPVRAGSSLQFAIAMGPDEYLLFYVVDVMRPSSGQHQNVIFASRERVALGAGVPAGPIERACARASACGSSPETMRECVERWADATIAPARLEAFVGASTCAEMLAVDAGIRSGSACAPDGARCEGAVALQCVAGTGIYTDCGATGQSCVAEGGSVRCETPGCPGARGCDGAGRAILCDGRGPVDCTALGLECAASTGSACLASGSACASVPDGQNACAGSTFSFCRAGREEPAFDCSRVPEVACDPVRQCAGGGECDPLAFSPSCEGTHLRYCVYDSLRDVDCASVGGSCGVDGTGRSRCLGEGAVPIDAGMPIDAGAPACGSASLGGPTVPETEIADYPTPTGGTILDGTYHLTRFDLWSAMAQPYTHQETLVVEGGMLTIVSLHSALGLSSSTGPFSTTGTDLTYSATCPAPMPRTWRYSVTPTGLVILDSSRISTYTRE